MQDLKVSIIQTEIHSDDPEANRKHFGSKIDEIGEATDLIVLPEMFTTGFPSDPQLYAEKTDGKTIQWMKERAASRNSVITGSIMLQQENKYYNALVWMQPDGNYSLYNKRHIFHLGEESPLISAGKEKRITEMNGWKISGMICYDLRFPVWSKNTVKEGSFEYDILIYVANWPAARSYPWKQLLIARAMENQAYVVGVNRIGNDKKKIPHTGDSMIIDPEGKIIYQAAAGKDVSETIQLSRQKLDEYRKRFNVAVNWDNFYIEQ